MLVPYSVFVAWRNGTGKHLSTLGLRDRGCDERSANLHASPLSIKLDTTKYLGRVSAARYRRQRARKTFTRGSIPESESAFNHQCQQTYKWAQSVYQRNYKAEAGAVAKV